MEGKERMKDASWSRVRAEGEVELVIWCPRVLGAEEEYYA